MLKNNLLSGKRNNRCLRLWGRQEIRDKTAITPMVLTMRRSKHFSHRWKNSTRVESANFFFFVSPSTHARISRSLCRSLGRSSFIFWSFQSGEPRVTVERRIKWFCVHRARLNVLFLKGSFNTFNTSQFPLMLNGIFNGSVTFEALTRE